jgi:hypothetical protein
VDHFMLAMPGWCFHHACLEPGLRATIKDYQFKFDRTVLEYSAERYGDISGFEKSFIHWWLITGGFGQSVSPSKPNRSRCFRATDLRESQSVGTANIQSRLLYQFADGLSR